MQEEQIPLFINNEIVEGFNKDADLFDDDDEYNAVAVNALNRVEEGVDEDVKIPPVGKKYSSFGELLKDTEEYAAKTGFTIAKNTIYFSEDKSDVKVLDKFFSDVPANSKVMKRGYLYCTNRNEESAAMLKMQNDGARLTKEQIRQLQCKFRLPYKFLPVAEMVSYEFIT